MAASGHSAPTYTDDLLMRYSERVAEIDDKNKIDRFRMDELELKVQAMEKEIAAHKKEIEELTEEVLQRLKTKQVLNDLVHAKQASLKPTAASSQQPVLHHPVPHPPERPMELSMTQDDYKQYKEQQPQLRPIAPLPANFKQSDLAPVRKFPALANNQWHDAATFHGGYSSFLPLATRHDDWESKWSDTASVAPSNDVRLVTASDYKIGSGQSANSRRRKPLVVPDAPLGHQAGGDFEKGFALMLKSQGVPAYSQFEEHAPTQSYQLAKVPGWHYGEWGLKTNVVWCNKDCGAAVWSDKVPTQVPWLRRELNGFMREVDWEYPPDNEKEIVGDKTKSWKTNSLTLQVHIKDVCPWIDEASTCRRCHTGLDMSIGADNEPHAVIGTPMMEWKKGSWKLVLQWWRPDKFMGVILTSRCQCY